MTPLRILALAHPDLGEDFRSFLDTYRAPVPASPVGPAVEWARG